MNSFNKDNKQKKNKNIKSPFFWEGLGWDKTKFTLLIALLITIISFGQQGINYKALIKDASGNVLANTTVNVQFTIQQGASLTDVYKEGHTTPTDDNGIIIVNIGEGNTTLGDFNTIDWSSDDHFLNVQINTGSGFVDMGTTQFMAVPYALHAMSANGGVIRLDDLEDAKSYRNSTGASLFIGLDAGLSDSNPSNYNIGIGHYSLTDNTTGKHNTASGYEALLSNTTGNNNTASGFRTLFSNTSGHGNTADGKEALYNNTIGYYNTASGAEALYNNTTGFANNANGRQSLYANTSGSYNTATGNAALYSNTTGEKNTATGRRALFNNTTGYNNTANGYHALYSNTTGINNVAYGDEALYSNTTGRYNTATGREALFSNTTGDYNTATGREALYNNTTGEKNTATGNYALYFSTSGYHNTATGDAALYGNTTGDFNTAIGRSALYHNTTGSNNIAIGFDAEASSSTASNEVTIGNSNNNAYRMFAASWTNASDRKLKHDIENIPVGLNFVLQLKPVQFVYNNANDEQKTLGFIAQEVKQTVNDAGLKENTLVSPLSKDYLGLRTTELIAVLTKAIQEQQKMINDLELKLETKNNVLGNLSQKVEKLLSQKKYVEIANNNK